MTDKTTCTGILNGDYGVQLASKALYVRIRGGVKSVTMRFDDQAAERMRLPSDVERRGTVVFSPDEFSKALGSNRVRIEVLTVLDSVELKDLQIGGIREAYENIQQDCPGDPISEKRGAGATAGESSLCSTMVMSRMRQRNISDADIKAICAR